MSQPTGPVSNGTILISGILFLLLATLLGGAVGAGLHLLTGSGFKQATLGGFALGLVRAVLPWTPYGRKHLLAALNR